MVEMQHIETTVTQMMALDQMNTEEMSQELQKPSDLNHQHHHQTQMAGHFKGNAADHSHTMMMGMEMMSIGMTNFPVAFFHINDIYQFLALLSLSLIAR